MRLSVVLNMSKILFFMGILKTEIGKMVENVWVSMEGQWADVSDTCVRTNCRLWSHGGYWMMPLWYKLQMWVRRDPSCGEYQFSGHICWLFHFAESRVQNTLLTCWWFPPLGKFYEVLKKSWWKLTCHHRIHHSKRWTAEHSQTLTLGNLTS